MAKFEKGDGVKIKHPYYIGETGRVNETIGTSVYVELDNSHTEHIFYENELDLID
jgi:ribosomal protein L21E